QRAGGIAGSRTRGTGAAHRSDEEGEAGDPREEEQLG
ncbi:unnamed protein product, partial [marine sediment metagenome]